MSNEVYGYFQTPKFLDVDELFSTIQNEMGIGIKSISVSELYNFPEQILPNIEDGNLICYLIGDTPTKDNATYLIDYLDYDKNADIGLPINGKDRLNILSKALECIFNKLSPTVFYIALTDSSQIDEIKTVKISNFNEIICSDFKKYAPPDCLYKIIEE